MKYFKTFWGEETEPSSISRRQTTPVDLPNERSVEITEVEFNLIKEERGTPRAPVRKSK